VLNGRTGSGKQIEGAPWGEMMESIEKATRKGSPPIKVYCLPEEPRQIEANANAAGLSLSNYLLNVGIGYQIRGIVDHEQVEELARINGDLGPAWAAC